MGLGFIGSHLVDELVDGGREVVVIDDFSTGKIENLMASKGNSTFHKKRVLDRGIKDVLKDVETAFHHVAQAKVRRSVEDLFL